jgi:hypothetical protein
MTTCKNCDKPIRLTTTNRWYLTVGGDGYRCEKVVGFDHDGYVAAVRKYAAAKAKADQEWEEAAAKAKTEPLHAFEILLKQTRSNTAYAKVRVVARNAEDAEQHAMANDSVEFSFDRWDESYDDPEVYEVEDDDDPVAEAEVEEYLDGLYNGPSYPPSRGTFEVIKRFVEHEPVEASEPDWDEQTGLPSWTRPALDEIVLERMDSVGDTEDEARAFVADMFRRSSLGTRENA